VKQRIQAIFGSNMTTSLSPFCVLINRFQKEEKPSIHFLHDFLWNSPPSLHGKLCYAVGYMSNIQKEQTKGGSRHALFVNGRVVECRKVNEFNSSLL
jgi:hypothetical protein